jgi:sortase B
MKKVLFTAVVLVLLAAFCISGFMVVNYLVEGKQQENRYDELSNIANSQQETTMATETTAGTEASTEATETTAATEPGMLAGYKEIYEMNNHTVGWIKMEGTQIDYPVMQTPDEPNFYLYRSFDKKDSARGSIYAREVCSIEEPSDTITP